MRENPSCDVIDPVEAFFAGGVYWIAEELSGSVPPGMD
jgi:hypothetical protein